MIESKRIGKTAWTFDLDKVQADIDREDSELITALLKKYQTYMSIWHDDDKSDEENDEKAINYAMHEVLHDLIVQEMVHKHPVYLMCLKEFTARQKILSSKKRKTKNTPSKAQNKPIERNSKKGSSLSD